MVIYLLCLSVTFISDFMLGDASPGYFSLTLNNGIRMEATSTRRAGLERFTFPKGNTPFFALDLANDSPGSFQGGNMTIDPGAGRIKIGGFWGSRHANYSFINLSEILRMDSQFWPRIAQIPSVRMLRPSQRWTEIGSVRHLDCGPVCASFSSLSFGELNLSHRNGVVARGLGETRLSFPDSRIRESGALFSFAGDPTQVIVRVGVSFVSEEQACSNAESEIGTATFEEIQARSKALWNERLSRIEIDVPRTPPNVTELLYSSLYRASLTPVSRFPLLEAEFRFLTRAYQEQCYGRGARRFRWHELAIL
jgi:hypothetical protein